MLWTNPKGSALASGIEAVGIADVGLVQLGGGVNEKKETDPKAETNNSNSDTCIGMAFGVPLILFGFLTNLTNGATPQNDCKSSEDQPKEKEAYDAAH